MASNDSKNVLHKTARSATGKGVNRQNTPFTNCAVSLRQVKKGGKRKDALKALEDLLKTSWSAYSVSPLFKWSPRESKLKRYSRRMCTHLAETLKTEEGDKFEVEYKIDERLKLTGNDDPAVKITVVRNEDTDPRQVFLGYLLSWGCPQSKKPKELDGLVYLPVLICTGSKKIANQVCRALETIHDCVVSPMELRESDRKELWMALLSYLDNKGETLTISYSIPDHPDVGDIDIKLSTNVTTRLSQLIYERYNGIVTYEEIALFWDEIHGCVHNIFRLKVANCEMTRLHHPEAAITPDKFRAASAKAMHVVLIFLTNMSAKLDSLTDGAEKKVD